MNMRAITNTQHGYRAYRLNHIESTGSCQTTEVSMTMLSHTVIGKHLERADTGSNLRVRLTSETDREAQGDGVTI